MIANSYTQCATRFYKQFLAADNFASFRFPLPQQLYFVAAVDAAGSHFLACVLPKKQKKI